MKKQILALALITGLTMTTVASADWGRGGRGYGNCPQVQGQMMQGPRFQQLDPETQAKIQQFFKDTQPLHKEMAMKRAEKQALMRNDNPDPQAVAKLTGELFDLKVMIREKAELAGVDRYVGRGGMGRGGRGHGFGMGQGGGMMNGYHQQ